MTRLSTYGLSLYVSVAWVSLGAIDPVVAQEGLVISEFLTFNTDSIRDEDGEYSDWIELYNGGDASIDLTGYYLTDNPENLAKWPFPAVTLDPGGFLVVFASEKDRRDAGSELHTNFRLDRQGELLVLLSPDGANVVAGYAPTYEPQVADTSFGIGTDSQFFTPVPIDHAVRVLVPPDGSLGDDWIAPDFDDSAWREGALGVGIERNPGGARSFDHLINTDVEAEMHDVNATIYIRSQFEIATARDIDSLTLSVKYDDGFVAYLNGVEVAAANAPEGAERTWNAEATRSHNDSAALEFVDFQISGLRGLLRDGRNVLAIHGLNFSPGSSDFLIAPTLEAVDVGPINPDVKQFFPEPTPGAVNRRGFDRAAPEPTFSVESGAYAESFVLELGSPQEGSVIRYTTDGSRPDATSTEYTEPISVDSTTTVTARVYLENVAPGHPRSESFMVIAERLGDVSSDLPIFLIDTFGGSIGESNWTGAFCQVIDVGEDGRARITDEPDFSGRAGLKMRGSSSLGFPKKQYSFEVWDEQNEDLSASILGMPRHADWILYAPYSDKSLMRNVLSYEWSNHIGRYAVRTKFVEVYMNQRRGSRLGSNVNDYLGVYVFMEKIKRDENRVDIDRLSPEDASEPEVTGGYILKKDRLDPGDTGFNTSRGQRLAYYYPKERRITSAQRSYIRGYINEFESALYGPSFRDPENGYARYIDVGSFIDHHIMVELTKNIDGYRLSTFMFKPREGKLHMGPIWDYNLSIGNANYLNGGSPVGWYYPQLNSNDYPWYPRLFQDSGFRAAYAARWTELRGELFTYDYLLDSLDRHASRIEESQARNFERWRILGVYVWPNFYVAPTWEDEMSWTSEWLEARIGWIDSQFVSLPERPDFSHEGGRVERGLGLEITSADEGDIFYTLDGSDPRGSRAVLGDGAILYEGPITIDANSRIVARVRSGPQFWGRERSATFVTDFPGLRISEIMYHPPEPTIEEDPQDEFSKSDFEFVEVVNIGDEPLDLGPYVLDRAVDFLFEEGSTTALGPGQYAVVVRDVEAFSRRYDTSEVLVLGEYVGTFSDRQEVVELVGELEIEVHDFRYRDTWYPETDGGGHSLVIRDLATDVDDYGEEASWAASAVALGSPGRAESGPVEGLQLPGDTTQDGALDLSDAVALLDHLFVGTVARLPCGDGTSSDAANVRLLDGDGNGAVNIGDALHILAYLFLSGPEPVEGRECIGISGCPSACSAE